MRRGPDDDVPLCVRWVGAPATVFALVILFLNDHVWKNQWPSPVTGKLSDVAGLVVAPPLLALVLALVRLCRPVGGSVLVTAVAFTAMKATAGGAAAASAGWSLVTPSHVVADPTDLVALPALLVAAHSARWARANTSPHRRVRLAVGSLMVPFVVVGTAATSACETHDTAQSVLAVAGRLSTDALSSPGALLVRTDHGQLVLREDRLQPMTERDSGRVQLGADRSVRQACSKADPSRCWRSGSAVVEVSTDAGRTWAADYAPSSAQRREVIDGLGQKCGERPQFLTGDVAVLDTPEGPVVAVALDNAGVARRGATGRWTRIPLPDRGSGTAEPTPPAVPGLPLPQDDLVPLDPPLPSRTPTPPPSLPTQPGQTRHPTPAATTI